jgi:hypothetical protein
MLGFKQGRNLGISSASSKLILGCHRIMHHDNYQEDGMLNPKQSP